MSEWVSVLGVFWILWALDGVRVLPRRIFTFMPGRWRRGAAVAYSRLSRPGVWPGCGRVIAADIPLAISPVGVCNRATGAAGRPMESPPTSQAWRWEEVRNVGVSEGWIYINGGRFCPDTGHVPAPLLLALAQTAPGRRVARIDALLAQWLRPAHLRRRARVLAGRTADVARLNLAALLGAVAVTLYLAGDVAGRVPAHVSERVALALPWVAGALLVLHLAAVARAWRTLARLKPVAGEKRRANLLSALLLPPQALRLRALLGEGFFPAQHPLAAALAFASGRGQLEIAFNVVADLRWPMGERSATALEREVTAGFRVALEAKVTEALAAANLPLDALLAPPEPDAPGSCRYCPRCRDQFAAGPGACPHGVELQPLDRTKPSREAVKNHGWRS